MARSVDTTDQPLKGVVLCCTSLTPDVRTKLAETASQMGAIHKLDLTADVTHLLVGSITTPKYRYVAKDRPDILVLQPGFVDAVRSAWMDASETLDLASLQEQYAVPPFHGLRISITGFEDIEQRSDIEKIVMRKGGSYSGDMTKYTTHLIVASTQSQKYIHAKQWGISTVSYKWFQDSLQRGMALDEHLYAPELPLDQQGIGAFRTRSETAGQILGKRARAEGNQDRKPEGEVGRRKLRKAASMRLEGHSQGLWHDISAQEVQVETSAINAWDDESQTLRPAGAPASPRQQEGDAQGLLREPSCASVQDAKLFSGHAVLIRGFEPSKVKTIKQYLQAEGASATTSKDELSVMFADRRPLRNCVLVPHKASASELPQVAPESWLVTEWWVERCIHHRRLLSPHDDALSGPLCEIAGFGNMTISTTGFEGVTLRQTAEAVKIVGASYQEKLLPSTSVLICGTPSVKKEKGYYASKHQIPIVSADWLWASLKTRQKEDFDRYLMDMPLLGSDNVNGRPSSSDSKPSEVSAKISVNQRPARLSNTRKQQSTPLSLGPSKTISTRRPGPFILEDDDDDDSRESTNADVADAQPRSLREGMPLRDISPNVSQRSHEIGSQKARSNKPDTKRSNSQDEVGVHASTGAEQSSERGASNPSLLDARLASDLRSLIAQRKGRTESMETSKRKQRPLGRNLSWVSNPSASSERGSPALDQSDAVQQAADMNSTADGFSLSREKVDGMTVPAGTQLGYDMEDTVEAHRRQMSKTMGRTHLRDDAPAGKRVVGVGTVKDSEMVVVQDAKSTRRTRQRR